MIFVNNCGFSGEGDTPNFNGQLLSFVPQKLLNVIFGKFPAMIWMADKTSKRVYFNERWLEFTGKLIQDEINEGWSSGIHNRDVSSYVTSFSSAFVNKQSFNVEFRLKHASGEYRWIKDMGWPLFYPDNVFLGYIGISEDITDEKVRKIVCYDRETYYRALVENIIDVITILTENKTIIYSSGAVKKILNYESDDIIGKCYTQLIHPDDVDIFAVAFERSLATPNTPIKAIYKVRGKNSDYKTLESIFNNMTSDMAVNGIIVNSHDISERIKMEDEFKQAKEMADSANKAKTQFIANISHEIRTPLNSIAGFVNLLTKTDLDRKQFEYLTYIHTSCEILMSLISNVLDFSKIEAQKTEIENIEFNLVELIDDIIQMTGESASIKKINLSASIDDRIGYGLIGDPKKLRQVILNLVSNAIKFTLEGCVAVRIELSRETDEKAYLLFSVSDDGIGIPADRIAKIFLPYDQLSPDISRIYGGTGLGLHISTELVKLMGGEKISVESNINKGSKFFFELAFGKSVILKTKHASSESAKSKSDKAFESFDILVVEDNQINYILVAELLKKIGHQVHKAVNGKDAIEKVRNNKYDLIFMDIQMPVMDGYEATRNIRLFNADIPIIAMTANAIRGDYEKCIQVGMNDYVAKPIEIDKVGDTILKNVKNRAACEDTGGRSRDIYEQSSAPMAVVNDTFDSEKFSKNTFGNKKLAADIINIFFADIKKYCEIIKNAIDSKDSKVVTQSAHRLKGSSTNVCSQRLRNIFFEMENAGRESCFEKAIESYQKINPELKNFSIELNKCGYKIPV